MVKQYKYLRETINDRGNETTTVERRVQEAARICVEILGVRNMEEMQKKKQT